MSKSRVLLLVSLLLLAASSLRADDLRGILASFSAGRYQDVIDRTTELLPTAGKLADAYHYLRGLAAFQIAWFGQAEDDLEPLADYHLGAGSTPASEIVTTVEAMRQTLPATTRELRNGREAIFRVYYDTDDKWTEAILHCLPDVYRAETDFYGPRLTETTVVIFADRDRYDAFSLALTKQTPPKWSLASGGNGLLMFCKHTPDPGYQVTPDILPSVSAHEFSHCLVHRVLGATALPMWLDEGLAEYQGSQFNKQDLTDDDQQITDLLDQNAVLPLSLLVSKDTFYDDAIAKRAYPEAFAMIRYFVAQLGRDGVVALLNGIHDGKTTEAAMETVWRGGLPAFYDDWLAATQVRVKRLRGGK